jgi:predicted DNA-binding transcriptional regulator AlpA
MGAQMTDQTEPVVEILTREEYERADQPVVLITKREVERRIGRYPATLWNWIRNGQFPMPRVLNPGSRREVVAWCEHEVEDWIASRPQRLAKPISDKPYEKRTAAAAERRRQKLTNQLPNVRMQKATDASYNQVVHPKIVLQRPE